jgi:FkbM family methyltransferase
MIVKNETAIIERCLAAAAPHIDCYVICDTGSTDATVEIIRKFFDRRGIPGRITSTIFRNFEQARNEALDAARNSDLEFDYILLCDADMELVAVRPGYKDELEEPAYWVAQQTVSGDLEYHNLRLLRRDANARYRGVTHEYLDVPGVSQRNFDGIQFLDHAAGANRANKFERDIALLVNGIEQEPNNTRYVFYLANSYFDLGDTVKALEMYQRRMTMGGWNEELFYSCYRAGVCQQRLDRGAEMITGLLETFEQFPHRAEPLHVIALHYQRKNRHRLAFHVAEMGARITLPASALFVEPEVYTWRLLDIMAVSLYYIDRCAEALELNRRLLTMVPESQRARILQNLEFCEKGRIPSFQQHLHANGENGTFLLKSEHARYPLRCRPHSSDPLVFDQIFIEREYSCLDDMTAAGLIIDCGAYVGYSSAYFLTRFPGCKLIAVEPDPANFEMLCQNLAPYSDAALAIPAAVWSRPARLAFSQTPYRDGKEWSRHVRECGLGETGDLRAEDIGSVLSQSGHERISILKMDIEGAEAQVFSENYESWIDYVDNIVIELHDDSAFGNASTVFTKAIAGRGFTVSRCGELTVCKRRGHLR